MKLCIGGVVQTPIHCLLPETVAKAEGPAGSMALPNEVAMGLVFTPVLQAVDLIQMDFSTNELI
jgi:hypothetical protein